jgi:hypothetical protein
MANPHVLDILKKLHTTYPNPHLEIEGAGEPSIEARYLCWLDYLPEGEGTQAIYVISDWYEDTSYVTEFDTEVISFPKSELEQLVELALASEGKSASLSLKGIHTIHKERWDDYADTHTGGPEDYHIVQVMLELKIEQDNPRLSLSYDEE